MSDCHASQLSDHLSIPTNHQPSITMFTSLFACIGGRSQSQSQPKPNTDQDFLDRVHARLERAADKHIAEQKVIYDRNLAFVEANRIKQEAQAEADLLAGIPPPLPPHLQLVLDIGTEMILDQAIDLRLLNLQLPRVPTHTHRR